MSQLLEKIVIPKKFTCTMGGAKEVLIYNDEVILGSVTLVYKEITGFGPTKENDGFYVELKNDKIISMHIKGSGFFNGPRARALGRKIFSKIYPLVGK